MDRKKFIKTCCYSTVGIPLAATLLPSCATIYYATSSRLAEKLVLARSEFVQVKKNKQIDRPFVLVKSNDSDFPICVYRTTADEYVAALLQCTHRGCELNVGGGIYSCPCHGSEFSLAGKVLEGPADRDLKTFRTETDNENIYIYLS